jgi:hypothetical protein
MSVNDSATEPPSTGRQRAGKFKIAGIAVAVAGLGTAGLIYWRGARSDAAADALVDGDSKIEVRQVESWYGTQGLLLQDLTNELKQPGTQVAIVLAATALIAAGCFYISHLEKNQE